MWCSMGLHIRVLRATCAQHYLLKVLSSSAPALTEFSSVVCLGFHSHRCPSCLGWPSPWVSQGSCYHAVLDQVWSDWWLVEHTGGSRACVYGMPEVGFHSREAQALLLTFRSGVAYSMPECPAWFILQALEILYRFSVVNGYPI